MTAVIRILGCAWLVVTITALAGGYVLIWALDGAPAAGSTFAGGGVLGVIGVAALLVPGLMLVALAAWLDWRHGRWSAK